MVRFKNRYFLFEIVWEGGERPPVELHESVVLNAVRESIRTNFGDYGNGVVGGMVQVKQFNSETGVGILRAPRDSHRTAWAALTFVTSIAKHACFVRVLHLGGTIRSCQRVGIRAGIQAIREREEEESLTALAQQATQVL